jgi:hypothetical protein
MDVPIPVSVTALNHIVQTSDAPFRVIKIDAEGFDLR